MSHEIRTPLNAILGMAELLVSSQLSDDQKEAAETIMLAGKNLLTIIDDILDFSKLEAGKMLVANEPFHSDLIVEEVVRTLQIAALKKR